MHFFAFFVKKYIFIYVPNIREIKIFKNKNKKSFKKSENFDDLKIQKIHKNYIKNFAKISKSFKIKIIHIKIIYLHV